MLNLFFIILEIFALGSFGALLFQKDNRFSLLISNSAAVIGSLLMLVFSIYILLSHALFTITIPTSFPLLSLTFHIDSLAAFFLLLISTIALPSSVYGIGYMKQYSKSYSFGWFGFFYNLFILSLFLVVTAYNGFYFLLVWELMSLSSLFLVIFEYKKPETIQAGIIYLIMTHVAAAFLVIAFLLLYKQTGSFDFSVFKHQAEFIPEITKNIIFLCMLIGFGTKAGIIPFHIWLPRAHSAAPSQVSALMSGVMIKMGIYMLFRMFLDILPHPTLWFSFLILIIGALSAVLGVLYALSEHDSKRLLAYHSIENIGIILLGLGSGLIFISLDKPLLATLAIIAGLFHTINHAIFKSLLFLGAGSVISQTHTRNLEEYGGLIKRMPYTAVFFLIGAIAIAGLPPLNGFASEWLTFQSLFAGIAMQSMLVKSIFIFAGACLAFTGGLAAACFVKAFGVTFLARPRSKESEIAHESPITITSSMAFLAMLCILFGLFASTIASQLQAIVHSLTIFSRLMTALASVNGAIYFPQESATLNVPMLMLSLLIIFVLLIAIVTTIARKQKIVFQTIWNCGFPEITPRMETTATGFSRSLIMIFKGIFQPTKQHEVEYIDADIRYFSKSRTVTLSITNIYEEYFYNPLHNGISAVSKKVRSIQGGNINQYLFYIFLLIICLLIFVRYSL